MKIGGRAINDTGKKFGMLTALRDVGSKNNQRLWLYRCDCGNEVVRVRSRIAKPSVAGQVSNCGCAISAIRSKNGQKGVTHGRSDHRLYDVWRQMLRRCEDTYCKDYPLYGQRGIFVCDDWHYVNLFISWAEVSGYRVGLTIERADNDGGYTPENCRWIPNEDQARNTRRLVHLSLNGETKFASDWARELGMSVRTILSRKRRGWTDEQALSTPIGGSR